MLWHHRIGHANVKNLNHLAKNNIGHGLPIKDFITFEKSVACSQRKHHCKYVACAQGKYHHKFNKLKLVNTIESLLQLIHVDLFCPASVLSISRNSYCSVNTDVCAHYTWAFCLANINEIAELIKRFIVLMENKTNLKVNGIVFENVVLNYFCVEKGIQCQYIAVRTAQQNGVAEKRNRTLVKLLA